MAASNSKKTVFIGYLAAFLATIIWGGNFVASRALAHQILPCQLNFWRWFIAFIAILPFALPHLKKDLLVLKSHFAYFTIMAFIGVTLMNIFIYAAGRTTSSLNMALIMPATPVVIIALARIIYKTPITLNRFFGMAIALTGILFLVSRGDLQKLLKLDFTAGDSLSIAGMLCFAIFSLFQKNRPDNISSLGFNTVIFGLGLLFCIPFALWEAYDAPLPPFSWSIAIGVLYSGIGCSTIGFWLWTICIDKIGPVASGIVYYSLPLYTAIMAHLILSESVSLPQFVGGAMIVSGIVLASIPRHAKKHAC